MKQLIQDLESKIEEVDKQILEQMISKDRILKIIDEIFGVQGVIKQEAKEASHE